MSQILVRDLASGTVEQLKKRAKRNRRSLQQEVRIILEEAASHPKRDMVALREAARRLRELNGPQTTDSADLIREDRDR